MRVIKAALALFPSKGTALSAIARLGQEGFLIKEIHTGKPYRASNGPIVGWCATSSWGSVLQRLSFMLRRRISEAHLRGIGIPSDALLRHRASVNPSQHIVVVYGPPDQLQRAIRMLRASDILEMDLY